MTEQRIRRGVFRSVDELIAAIDDYIAANNRAPKPFTWTASAELILDRDSLDLFARHHETGEPIPSRLFKK